MIAVPSRTVDLRLVTRRNSFQACLRHVYPFRVDDPPLKWRAILGVPSGTSKSPSVGTGERTHARPAGAAEGSPALQRRVGSE